MLGGSLLLFLLLFYFFPSPPIRSREAFSSVIFPLFLFFYLFFWCSDGMERETWVCDHGLERSDLCAEIIIIIHDCSPIPVFCFLYFKILPVTKMRLNVCFNEMALFVPFVALIKG